MSELQIEFIDDNFTVEKSEEYQLLIKQDKLIYQMAILDDENHLLLLLSWQKDTNEDRIQHLLNLSYKSKKIALNSKNILLIPNELYDIDQEINYLNLLYLSRTTNTLLTDHLTSLSASLLYGLPTSEIETIQTQFPATQLHSRNTALLCAWKLFSKEETFFAINFNGEQTDFCYFANGSLMYYHTHPSQHADELNYFFLAIVQEQKIDLSGTPLYLSGKINEQHAFYKRLGKYSKQMQFMDLSSLISCENYKVQQKAHNSLSLFGLLCV